jgi:hypothetical protein
MCKKNIKKFNIFLQSYPHQPLDIVARSVSNNDPACGRLAGNLRLQKRNSQKTAPKTSKTEKLLTPPKKIHKIE